MTPNKEFFNVLVLFAFCPYFLEEPGDVVYNIHELKLLFLLGIEDFNSLHKSLIDVVLLYFNTLTWGTFLGFVFIKILSINQLSSKNVPEHPIEKHEEQLNRAKHFDEQSRFPILIGKVGCDLWAHIMVHQYQPEHQGDYYVWANAGSLPHLFTQLRCDWNWLSKLMSHDIECFWEEVHMEVPLDLIIDFFPETEQRC